MMIEEKESFESIGKHLKVAKYVISSYKVNIKFTSHFSTSEQTLPSPSIAGSGITSRVRCVSEATTHPPFNPPIQFSAVKVEDEAG